MQARELLRFWAERLHSVRLQWLGIKGQAGAKADISKSEVERQLRADHSRGAGEMNTDLLQLCPWPLVLN